MKTVQNAQARHIRLRCESVKGTGEYGAKQEQTRQTKTTWDASKTKWSSGDERRSHLASIGEEEGIVGIGGGRGAALFEGAECPGSDQSVISQ